MEQQQAAKWLRIVSVLFLAGILVFLFFSGAATVIRQPVFSSFYENRSLEQLPEYSSEGLLDGSYCSALNTFLQEHALGRNTLLRWATMLNLKILRRPVVNDVVIRKDVLLGWQDFWIYDRDDLKKLTEKTADRIAGHARAAEAYGGRYYYVAVPHQALAFAGEYPDYLQSHEEYFRDTADYLAKALEDRDVPFMDMWAVFRRKGILQDVSSRIDNHFSIVGAVETCRCLLDRISADTCFAFCFLAEGNYRIEWLPNHYLGSRTRKLFDLWPSQERLGIVITNDEPEFTRTDRSSRVKGQTESRSVYALPSAEDEIVAYDLYMGGDWGCTEIRTGRPELPSILIYGDSFTNPVECILWQGFDTMYSFDFRHYTEQDLDELIARYQPDIVVCIRDYEAVLKADGNGS